MLYELEIFLKKLKEIDQQFPNGQALVLWEDYNLTACYCKMLKFE